MNRQSIINRNEWRIVGMSRSGTHAIIHWMLAQAEGRACFLNCAEPKNNPFCWLRPLGNGLPYITNYPDFVLEREQRGVFSRKDYLMYSHEDVFLGMLRNPHWESNHDAWVGPSARRRDILILRDPFNLFASRTKIGIGSVSPHTAMRIWKQHAREFLGLRRYLPQPRVLISYNDWVCHTAYRRRIAKEFKFPFTDAGFHDVPDTAGGSSFDGVKYRRRASGMKVFDRWREFIQCEEYRRLFDQEALRLSRAIFGSLAAQRPLFGKHEERRGVA